MVTIVKSLWFHGEAVNLQYSYTFVSKISLQTIYFKKVVLGNRESLGCLLLYLKLLQNCWHVVESFSLNLPSFPFFPIPATDCPLHASMNPLTPAKKTHCLTKYFFKNCSIGNFPARKVFQWLKFHPTQNNNGYNSLLWYLSSNFTFTHTVNGRGISQQL